jgi:hypothetical protein
LWSPYARSPLLMLSFTYTGVSELTRTSIHEIFLLSPGALVRQRTIPTERPPLVGEVSANFSG